MIACTQKTTTPALGHVGAIYRQGPLGLFCRRHFHRHGPQLAGQRHCPGPAKRSPTLLPEFLDFLSFLGVDHVRGPFRRWSFSEWFLMRSTRCMLEIGSSQLIWPTRFLQELDAASGRWQEHSKLTAPTAPGPPEGDGFFGSMFSLAGE